MKIYEDEQLLFNGKSVFYGESWSMLPNVSKRGYTNKKIVNMIKPVNELLINMME